MCYDNETEKDTEYAPRSIVLLGLKHSGKSTISQLLSRRLAIPRVDTDDLIAEAAGCNTAREAYGKLGEARFRRLECEVCTDLARRAAGESMIIATGGGVADNENVLEKLAAGAVLLYLFDSEEALFERFMESGRPAFLPEDGPEEAWSEIFRRRDRFCRKWASFIIDCRGRTMADIADETEALVCRT